MVSSQVSGFTGAPTCKSIQSRLLVSVVPPDAVPSDYVEFDFSDVFGPVNSEIFEPGTELISEDSMVIHNRSHSLVGPTTCPSPSLKFSKLTLQDMESLDVVECGTQEKREELVKASIDEDVVQNLADQFDNDVFKKSAIGLEDFEVMKVVGQGSFGKVFQVKKKGTLEVYAMKVVRKDKIMEKNHVEYMKAERDIMTKLDHPYIVQLRYSFQTKYRLYLVLDFVNGGHLFFQLYHHGLFREDLARVYTAEMVSAVSHLHANGIMHRDLKPENILLDADGHAMLTDFGLAKEFEENTRSNSMCGTLEYMAPEIVLAKGHDKAADWWSVGILMFEMLTGKPPFVGNRQKIQQKIIKDKIKLPAFLTSEAHSLLKGLLQKEPCKRLGNGETGSEEIKKHKWFKAINWKKLEERETKPSFIPEVAGIHCTANFGERWTNMSLVDSPASSPTPASDISFKDFSYVKPPASFLQRNNNSALLYQEAIEPFSH